MANLFFNTEMISKDTSNLEKMANQCYMPVRYFFQGRTIEYVDGKIQSETISFPEKNWRKTAFAILTFVPGILIGTVLKLLSLVFSKKREHQGVVPPIDKKPVAEGGVKLLYSPNAKNYQHYLPRSTLDSYFTGNAFDNQKSYTDDERERARKDIEKISQKIFDERPIKQPLAIMTAGAPGSGKTTLLRQDRAKEMSQGRKIAYICPDDVCLKGMEKTYVAEVEANLKMAQSEEERKKILADAYTKYRPCSNAAAQMILANLIRNNFAFYFGTTSTSATAVPLFQLLREKGYQIRLLHITSPEDVRWESIKVRDKTFVQTTETDIKEKGRLFPQKINDYLAYADRIEFYFRNGVAQDAKLAAVWLRTIKNDKGVCGELSIVDQACYEQIRAVHNGICDELSKQDLKWEATVEQASAAYVA